MIQHPSPFQHAKTIHTAGYVVLLRHLKQRRRQLGLTQGQLAVRVGRSRRWVQRIESCYQRLDFVEAIDLLSALGLEVDSAVRLVRENAR